MMKLEGYITLRLIFKRKLERNIMERDNF